MSTENVTEQRTESTEYLNTQGVINSVGRYAPHLYCPIVSNKYYRGGGAYSFDHYLFAYLLINFLTFTFLN